MSEAKKAPAGQSLRPRWRHDQQRWWLGNKAIHAGNVVQMRDVETVASSEGESITRELGTWTRARLESRDHGRALVAHVAIGGRTYRRQVAWVADDGTGVQTGHCYVTMRWPGEGDAAGA